MARVRRNQEFDGWFEAHVGRGVRAITEAVARDAIAGCPIDSGDLVDTIGTRYPGGLRGVVIVGTGYWWCVEYPTRPHEIRVRTKKVLANTETGEFFGRVVHHPGTQAQPFMRPAIYKKRRLSNLPGRTRDYEISQTALRAAR